MGVLPDQVGHCMVGLKTDLLATTDGKRVDQHLVTVRIHWGNAAQSVC